MGGGSDTWEKLPNNPVFFFDGLPMYDVKVCYFSLVNLRAVPSAPVVMERQKKAEWLPCFGTNYGTKRVRRSTLPVVNAIIILS